jgi:hypothetical protein
MANIYSELYYALKSYGIRSLVDLHLLQPKIGKQGERSFNLRKDIYDAMSAVSPHVESALEPVKGIKLFINVIDDVSMNDSSIMKSLVYGEKIVLVSKEFKKSKTKREKDFSKYNSKGTYARNYDYGIDNSFISALIRYRELIDNGVIYIKPEYQKIIIPNNNKQISRPNELKISSNVNNVFSDFSAQEKKTFSKRIGFGLLKIPTLANANIKDVLSLREENSKSFHRFQFELARLLNESRDGMTDEQKINSLIYSTQMRVNELEEQVKDYYSKNKFRLATATVGTAIACVCAFSSKENSELLAALIGTSPALSFFSVYNDMRSDHRAIVNHDYYFPWKINASICKIG